VRILEHPRAGRIVLGAVKPHDQHAPMLRLSDYRVGEALPTPMASVEYLSKAVWIIKAVLKNNDLGCCVISEDGHYIGVLTANANVEFSYSDAQIVADYVTIAHYVVGDPSTDQGTDPIADMNYRVKVGYADGSKDLGYLIVDATNEAEIKFAIEAFGNVKIWMALPESYISPFPSGDGFVWDVDAPNPQNGHCFGGYGYDVSEIEAFKIVGVSAKGIVIDTWGDVGILTWAAAAKLCVPSAGGGMATRVNPDWLGKATQKTPSGFDWSTLLSDFDTMGGTVPVPPAPTPVPQPPAPPPTAPPTLAQLDAAVDQTLAGDFYLIPRSTAAEQVKQAIAALFPAAS
jgi:hypothetical protein